MAYWRPDGIEAFSTRGGGVQFLITRRGRMHTQIVEPEGCVSVVEASRILRPLRSRVAVQKWIVQGISGDKLRALKVEGEYRIAVSELRRFANKHGYGWPELAPGE